ncbi:MAG: hypothetical protein EA392_08775 [Cryomorphaceae bacterium]|nr:MAG: hypothetical protein EA392_08775 [Cryomorphaceae bacterium]
MNSSSLPQLRKIWKDLSAEELHQLLDRLGRFSRDNKELLHYLLVFGNNEDAYISAICHQLDEGFEGLNRQNITWTRKGLRRLVRMLNRYVRYSGKTDTEIVLRTEFCNRMLVHGIPLEKSAVVGNMFNRELDRISRALSKLHPDQQLDYDGWVQTLHKLEPVEINR